MLDIGIHLTADSRLLAIVVALALLTLQAGWQVSLVVVVIYKVHVVPHQEA